MRTARGGPNRRAGVLACLAVACGLAACDRPAPVGPSESVVQASQVRGFAPEVAMEVKAVGSLLAEGLGEPEARAAIHTAMRESPLTHHAIVLSEFVGTPEGAGVLRAVTERTGVAEADLRQRVGVLAPLQLYLPIRAQRRSWRAAESIAVVALTD